MRSLALVILLLAFVSTTYSMDRQVTIAAALILALVFVCAFVFLWRVVDTELELTRFVHGVYRAVWPLIVVSIALIPLTDFHPLEGRYGGIFRNANGLGLISAMLFPITIWEIKHSEIGPKRLIAYVTLVCVLLGVGFSGSRSAMIGVVMSGGVLLLYRYRVGFAAFLFLVLTCLLGYVAAGGWGRLDSATEDEILVFVRAGSLDDLGGRTEKWGIAWDYIRQKPWLGWGYGTSRLVTTGELEDSVLTKAAGIQGLDFHSSHVQTAIELGFLGVALVEILVVLVLVTGFSLFRHMRRESLPLLGVALFASLMVMLGDTFVHGWLFSPGSGMSFMFWLYTALVTRTAVVAARKRAEAAIAPPAMPSIEPA